MALVNASHKVGSIVVGFKGHIKLATLATRMADARLSSIPSSFQTALPVLTASPLLELSIV